MLFDPLRISEQEVLRGDRDLTVERLCKCISRDLIVFVGAGVSASLGYPSWSQFGVQVLEQLMLDSDECLAKAGITRGRVGSLLDLARQLPTFDVPSLLHVLGCADKVREVTCDLFKLKEQELAGTPDLQHPLAGMLRDWPVRRFITTNYDHVLEQEIRRLGKNLRSFTQRDTDRDSMLEFIEGSYEDDERAVFHCHGSQTDASTLIVTEKDYRDWYLAEHSERGETLRQVLPIILDSAPILFVGFSLQDLDLLRPLRQLQAMEPDLAARRPLFTLQDRADVMVSEASAIQIRARFGVEVLWFDREASPDFGLSAELAKIFTRYRDWEEQRFEKPKLRTPRVQSGHEDTARPAKYYRFALDISEEAPRVKIATGPEVDAVLEKLEEKAVVLLGNGASGKSVLAYQVAKEFRGEVFYWSSFYADDWLSFLDRLSIFLERHGVPKEDPAKRGQRKGSHLFRDSRILYTLDSQIDRIGDRRVLVVLDGAERLLIETSHPKVGQPYSHHIRRMLSILGAGRSAGASKNPVRLLITSRLWPEVSEDVTDAGGVGRTWQIPDFDNEDAPMVCKPMVGLRGNQVVDFLPSELGQDVALTLGSLLDGHAYSLLLAAKMFELSDDPDRTIDRILRVLSTATPSQAPTIIVREAVAAVTRTDPTILGFLRRVAVFAAPVSMGVLQVCAREAGTDLDAAIRKLSEARILYKVFRGDGDIATASDALSTIHPVVRGYIFFDLQGMDRDDLPAFTLPGFTSGTYAEYPGSKSDAAEMTKDLFLAFCSKFDAASGQSLREFCRAAFGVLRSRMDSNAIPRWWQYTEYSQFLSKMLTMAREASYKLAGAELWTFRDPSVFSDLLHNEAPLHAEELAWVYNDLGLCCCSEGDMFDALDFWKQGYELNFMIEGGENGQFVVQSQLHLGHTFLEMGRLDFALQYLERARASNVGLNDTDLNLRIDGYTAVVHHLQGRFGAAKGLYERVVGEIESRGNNRRALAIFRRHLAGLLIRTEEYGLARRHALDSRADSLEGNYPDLVAFADNTLGHIFRAEKNYNEAARHYHIALSEAERLGILRLKADVLSELSRLAIEEGEFEAARERAQLSLTMALKLGLGLRQSHALVLLGMANAKAGNKDLAIAFLMQAKLLSQRQSYHTRHDEAQRLLYELMGSRAANVPSASSSS